jgi:hypothetical protein
MVEKSNELLASNLVIAFYSAVEPRRRKDVRPEGLDLRIPSISADEVFDVYKRFLNLVEGEGHE